MINRRLSLTVLPCACMVAFIQVVVGETVAATKKAKVSASALVATALPTPNSEQGQKPSGRPIKKSGAPAAVLEHKPKPAPKQVQLVPSESKLPSAKSHRRVKVNKKVTPKAVVQPRRDLMYHGMLEDPQRYDPRPTSRTAGVPNPLTPDLTHDHFQELDRNQDGKIDPVERAFGRLDMDRDLGDRQFR